MTDTITDAPVQKYSSSTPVLESLAAEQGPESTYSKALNFVRQNQKAEAENIAATEQETDRLAKRHPTTTTTGLAAAPAAVDPIGTTGLAPMSVEIPSMPPANFARLADPTGVQSNIESFGNQSADGAKILTNDGPIGDGGQIVVTGRRLPTQTMDAGRIPEPPAAVDPIMASGLAPMSVAIPSMRTTSFAHLAEIARPPEPTARSSGFSLLNLVGGLLGMQSSIHHDGGLANVYNAASRLSNRVERQYTNAQQAVQNTPQQMHPAPASPGDGN